jgi:hypothetical protein
MSILLKNGNFTFFEGSAMLRKSQKRFASLFIAVHRGACPISPSHRTSATFPTRQEAPGSIAEHVRGVMVDPSRLARSDEVRAMPAHRRGRIAIDFALEAKCKGIDSGVGVKELARLISRLRHRQFGVLVTTSFLAEQAYKELRQDGHPVVVIAATDIAQILTDAGLRDEAAVLDWLRTRFPREAIVIAAVTGT